MQKKLNPNFIRLVKILSDGEYHDGTLLGKRLHMTRSAVWKSIKKLRGYGIQIDSLKGKGYALKEPLILLEESRIKLPSEKIDIKIFEAIDSTNEFLKKTQTQDTIAICLAEQQTKGRGRFNRYWHSPFGKNIYLSCAYPFKKDVSELAGLSLIASLAILKTMKTYEFDQHLLLKWPNDVIYKNKKLAGSLLEIQAEAHGASSAVIGMGINVNMLHADEDIHQPWISMQKILGKYIDRNEFCARLIDILTTYFAQFEMHGFSEFEKEWANWDGLRERQITLKNLDTKICGKMVGINKQGHLLLQSKNGTIRSFASGDTSIVKNS